jgi:serine/threonine protein kinase
MPGVKIDTLGHYKILDRIGAGGLGEVYRARDTRLGRTVAVKVPGAELQADDERREALLRDARIAGALSHPNIAAFYEIGDEGGRLFLVFEFVPGEPLKRVIAGRPLNVRRAVDLATQVADAIAEAHAQEIVHGDLTPDTIMLTPKGNAKILDFGFARWMGRTPGGASDYRADIVALGTVLFEMLTGRQPDAGHITEPGTAGLGRTTPGARTPPELDEVLSKALGARVEGGYESAATCAAELRAVAAILDIRAASAEPARVMPIRRERRSGAWVILAVVVVVAALAAARWLF